jgi:hypothetical protein
VKLETLHKHEMLPLPPIYAGCFSLFLSQSGRLLFTSSPGVGTLGPKTGQRALYGLLLWLPAQAPGVSS